MKFKNWLSLFENHDDMPYWGKGEENPIPQWAQDVPTYHNGLIKMNKRYPGFLDINNPDFYNEFGKNRKVWHTPDGELGYSLLPNDGKTEISGIYNLGGKKRFGHGKHAARRGFAHGGNILHAFEGDKDSFSLPHFYHRAIGVQPTAYYPFDPSLAHKDWNYERFGKPGLVRLETPPESQDIEKWLNTDHGDLSHDEFQDRLRYLKRMALGSKMKEDSHPDRHCTERLSKQEIDKLVQNVDNMYFGDDDPDDKIGRYIQMKAFEANVSIEEAAKSSMSRLFHHMQSEKPIVIITGFRHEQNLRQNRGSNVSLAADIRKLGWGYTPVVGGFVEKDQEGNDVHVQEESLFVNADGDSKHVLTLIQNLLKKYNQEAALVKLPEDPVAVLLWSDGRTTPAGEWKADPDLMATYYTRMRSGARNRQFKFEAAGDDSKMTRWAVDLFFKNK